jgi:ribosomal protein RSM22 (predicted rRNA methylase)
VLFVSLWFLSVQFTERLILERAFGPAVAAQYEQGRLPERLLAPVAQAATTLSLRFTGREKLERGYLKDRDLRLAYLLYYLPSNLPKSGFLLNEIAAHPEGLLARQRLRLLDIGAGQGAATLGTLDYFAGNVGPSHFDIVAVDLNAQPLEDYRWLVTNYMRDRAISYTLKTHQGNLERGLSAGLGGEFDLIVAANLINELFLTDSHPVEMRAQWLAEKIGGLLAEDGSLLIIEPALKESTRALMELRDRLSGYYGFTIYSPCPTAGNCPMLPSERDWCHSVVDWQRPGIVAQIDKMIGNRKEMLKFSYLILRRDGRRLSDLIEPGPDRTLWRLVSDPHSEKGRAMIRGCGGGQFLPLVRLKRAASETNAGFKSVERGQLVTLEKAEMHEREVRIEEKTSIEIQGPFFK